MTRTAPQLRIALSLFLCVFAAQSGMIALSPVLAAVAADFGVSTAVVGQLRTVTGLAAGLASLALPAAARRFGLSRLLRGGAVLLAVAALASAAAPTLAALALCQLPLGIAVSILMAAATSAAGDWVDESARGSVLGWTLMGSPAAWIAGMPLLGLLGAVSWRIGWLALPLAASLAALVVVPSPDRRDAPREDSGDLRLALGDPLLRRWLLAELAANSAWLGMLVYAGALFADDYGSSSVAIGAVLALAAVAFALGNLVFRRFVAGASGGALVRLALGMALLAGLFGACRPAPVVSAALLAAASFLGGARTLLGNAYGLAARPERSLPAMAARAAANQFGAFVGAATAGAALAVGGYSLFGIVLALEFALSTVPLRRRRRGRATLPERLRRAGALARAR
jgi:MFS transporter, DHA1 family, inner membrane transport protein